MGCPPSSDVGLDEVAARRARELLLFLDLELEFDRLKSGFRGWVVAWTEKLVCADGGWVIVLLKNAASFIFKLRKGSYAFVQLRFCLKKLESGERGCFVSWDC